MGQCRSGLQFKRRCSKLIPNVVENRETSYIVLLYAYSFEIFIPECIMTLVNVLANVLSFYIYNYYEEKLFTNTRILFLEGSINFFRSFDIRKTGFHDVSNTTWKIVYRYPIRVYIYDFFFRHPTGSYKRALDAFVLNHKAIINCLRYRLNHFQARITSYSY